MKQIDQLNKVDQAVHCMLPNNSKDVAFVKKMNEVNDTISLSLSKLMEKYDYLSENVIGATFKDTMLSTEPAYGVLVLHEFQKNGSRLTNILNNAIHLGKVKAEIGLQWLEQGMTTRIRFVNDYVVYKNILYRNKIDFSSKNRVENMVRLLFPSPSKEATSNRLYYYVDSSDNIINKMIYNLKTRSKRGPFLFCIAYKNILSLAMPEEDFIKNKGSSI